MSYLVLARKHRPRDFGALVGQEHVVQALANALTQQRLHHAYLFTGTRGVGKTTVSRILAKSLNCTGPDGQGGITAQPCGVCDACREIDSGRFVDYVELDAASNRGVDEISQLLDQAVYKPVMGRFKVYMIDEVHMLSTTAFNAMLKTLEEPPEYLKFVLATTDPQKVPPTVLSRCLQFNLRPMAPATVAEHLATVLAAEGIEAEAGALRLLARAARGSMRDGLSLADQAIAFGAGRLQEAAVRQMLGAVDRGHAVRLVEALARSDGRAVVEVADGLRALGLSASGTLEEMAVLLQQMALARALPDALDAGDPDAPVVARLAGLLAADETQLLYSMALHGRAELPLAPDEHSGLVMVLLRMLAFRPAGEGEPAAAVQTPNAAVPTPAATVAAPVSVAARPPAPEPAAPIPASPPPRQAPVARAAENEPPPWLDAPPEDDEPAPPRSAAARMAGAAQVTVAPLAVTAPIARVAAQSVSAAPAADEDSLPALAVDRVMQAPDSALGSRWVEVVTRLVDAGLVTALVRELAMQAQCLAIEQDGDTECWHLRVEREILRSPQHCNKLQAALTESFGRPVRLQVESGSTDDTPARREAAAQARRQAEAEEIIHNDPLVRMLLQQFKTARIVPGSIRPH